MKNERIAICVHEDLAVFRLGIHNQSLGIQIVLADNFVRIIYIQLEVGHDGKGGMIEEFSGKLLVQQEPTPSVESTPISPPIWETMLLQIESPSPVP